MKWKIVADSSCDLFGIESDNDNIEFSTIPFKFNIDNREFVDDENIDINELNLAIENCKKTCASACPSPGEWYKEFNEDANIFAVTISKNLSGSYDSAVTAMNMIREDTGNNNIHVFSSISTGPGLVIIIEKIIELINLGLSYEEIIDRVNGYIHHTHTIFALCSFDNLVRNGRVPKIVGLAARALKIWGIGAGTSEGTIAIKGKARGEKKCIDFLIKDIKGKNISDCKLIISHAQNEGFALKLKERLQQEISGLDITIHDTRGLDTFYAEHLGVIVCYEGALNI